LFHFEGPPTNPEEQAIWDWWISMDRADPEFQWKTPIEFYGKVIDQHGDPVVGANVECGWTTVGATPKAHLTTDANGNFEIKGIQGKGMIVDTRAKGYHRGASARGSFEYSAFYESIYHVPDKNNPVIFQLWKLEGAEPMYWWRIHQPISVKGERLWFDTTTGKVGATGDVAISTERGTTYAPRQFDYTITVEAGPGGGIFVRNEEMMFEAPEGGYQPSFTVEQLGQGESMKLDQNLRFYLKTPTGKYAAVKLEVSHYMVPEADVTMVVYFNPSGSRNLQYDGKQRINKEP
jgi:hypothetical protein